MHPIPSLSAIPSSQVSIAVAAEFPTVWVRYTSCASAAWPGTVGDREFDTVNSSRIKVYKITVYKITVCSNNDLLNNG